MTGISTITEYSQLTATNVSKCSVREQTKNKLEESSIPRLDRSGRTDRSVGQYRVFHILGTPFVFWDSVPLSIVILVVPWMKYM